MRGEPTSKPDARRALVVLLALNILCYLDRYILAAVEPEIRQTFFAPEDPDALAKTGFLATAFLLSYRSSLAGWGALFWAGYREGRAPIRNFAGCVSMMAVLICFVCS